MGLLGPPRTSSEAPHAAVFEDALTLVAHGTHTVVADLADLMSN